ncbi:hypothetical protein C8F04DRAFT_1097591, partial [Mycena alexandri]
VAGTGAGMMSQCQTGVGMMSQCQTGAGMMSQCQKGVGMTSQCHTDVEEPGGRGKAEPNTGLCEGAWVVIYAADTGPGWQERHWTLGGDIRSVLRRRRWDAVGRRDICSVPAVPSDVGWKGYLQCSFTALLEHPWEMCGGCFTRFWVWSRSDASVLRARGSVE